jgi:hypothetical protein
MGKFAVFISKHSRLLLGRDKVKAFATGERPVYEVGVHMVPSATEAMQSAGDRDDKGCPSNSEFEALAWRRKIRLGKGMGPTHRQSRASS